MTTPVRRATLLFLLIASGLLAGCHHGSPSYLFVVSSDKGRLEPGADGTYRLDLEGVSQQVVYFSDRPERLAGTTSLDAFLHEWNKGRDSFAKTPPNAALSAAGSDHIEVVEIWDPRRSGDTLSYTLRLLEDSDAFAAGAPSPGGSRLEPGALGRVVLFIDDLSYYKSDPMNRPDNFGLPGNDRLRR